MALGFARYYEQLERERRARAEQDWREAKWFYSGYGTNIVPGNIYPTTAPVECSSCKKFGHCSRLDFAGRCQNTLRKISQSYMKLYWNRHGQIQN